MFSPPLREIGGGIAGDPAPRLRRERAGGLGWILLATGTGNIDDGGGLDAGNSLTKGMRSYWEISMKGKHYAAVP